MHPNASFAVAFMKKLGIAAEYAFMVVDTPILRLPNGRFIVTTPSDGGMEIEYFDNYGDAFAYAGGVGTFYPPVESSYTEHLRTLDWSALCATLENAMEIAEGDLYEEELEGVMWDVGEIRAEIDRRFSAVTARSESDETTGV